MVVEMAIPRTREIAKALFSKAIRKFNSFTCTVMNGGHEFYTIRHDGGDLRQQCLLCGHETKGIKIGKDK